MKPEHLQYRTIDLQEAIFEVIRTTERCQAQGSWTADDDEVAIDREKATIAAHRALDELIDACLSYRIFNNQR